MTSEIRWGRRNQSEAPDGLPNGLLSQPETKLLRLNCRINSNHFLH